MKQKWCKTCGADLPENHPLKNLIKLDKLDKKYLLKLALSEIKIWKKFIKKLEGKLKGKV